ncbi:FAD-dependent monooxygenase [Pseudonocardia sp. Cha107L01]|uniref:FAD-dependent monooxygenase n=1 Tax=Pseudonocardia sp. Cha107L01 TaxID=3457576 RepID=UPI00403E9BDD
MKPRRAEFLVMGGGIGGLAAALALAREGLRVLVLERAAEFGEVGAGLQVGPNASRMLDRLGVLPAVTRDAFFPRRLLLRDAVTGAPITALETADAFRERFGYRYLVTHRADLHRAVVEACRDTGLVELLPAKRVLEVEPRAGGALVRCADGTRYDTDALVAADGVHSLARGLLVADGPPVDSGYVAYRGTVGVAELVARGGLPEPDGMVIWVGAGRHLVQYPVRRGELCNQVATFDTRAFPTASGENSGKSGTSHTSDIDAQLDRAFQGTCAEVTRGVEMVDRSRRWAMVDRLPAAGWSQGHLTLLGDAAHPMLQYLAQGACQAIEDAVVLADSVSAHPGDVEAAFKTYEAIRFPRTARVQTTARTWGEILHVGGIGATERAALLGQRAADDFEPVDWLYGDPLCPNPAGDIREDVR